jgi:hypothetical protein
MSSAPTLNIREAIDEITLAVAHPGKNDLSTEISEQAWPTWRRFYRHLV